MKVHYSNERRGFQDLRVQGGLSIGESSAIGDYDDAMDIPGSSALWLECPRESYNREEIANIIEIFQWWLDSGRLPDSEQLPQLGEGIEVEV